MGTYGFGFLTHMQPVDLALVLVDALQVYADHDAVLYRRDEVGEQFKVNFLKFLLFNLGKSVKQTKFLLFYSKGFSNKSLARAVKVLFQMNFVQFSSSFAPKNGPLVQFIVQFFTINIQEKEELSSVQVPKNQVNFMNLVL